jgi:hypothetical protein
MGENEHVVLEILADLRDLRILEYGPKRVEDKVCRQARNRRGWWG